MLRLTILLLQTVTVPAPRPLGKPDATLAREFTRIVGLSERPDGRAVVVDRGEQLVLLADFGTRTATPIGRHGSGPQEYRFPGRLIPMPGDSLMVADDGNSRLAVLGPDATIRRTARGSAPGLPIELTPRAVDGRGRFYALVPAWVLEPTGVGVESLPIVRFVPGGSQLDTVGRLKRAPKQPPPKRQDKPTVPMFIFAGADSWTATASGRVAVIRAADYRVEWVDENGRRTIGPAIAWKPVTVTDRDRTEYMRSFLLTSGVSGGRGSGTTAPGALGAVPAEFLTDKAVAEMVENTSFATTKGPFTDASPIVAPDGTLWIERSVPAGAPSTWDHFDGAGRPIQGIELPLKRRLVGIGRGTVYLVSVDEDGIERLERYRIAGER